MRVSVKNTKNISCIAIVLFYSHVANASEILVDVTQYMTQATAGQSICTSNINQCVHGYPNQYGEYTLFYAFNDNRPPIVDYIARSYGGGANGGSFIGVIRNIDSGQLRCFADPGQLCTAPPRTSSMPEGVPKSLLLNVVSEQDDKNASNPDGTPRTQIAGARNITGMQTFQVNNMNMSNCMQTPAGKVGVTVSAAFLYAFPFGGDIGTQNALVIEEIETKYINGQLDSHPDHIERYYYVNQYGRVREATSSYSTATGQFTNSLGNNPIRNKLRAVSLMPPEPPNTCPQGTRPLSE